MDSSYEQHLHVMTVFDCISDGLLCVPVFHRSCPRSSCSSTRSPKSTAARPSRRSTEPRTPRTSTSALSRFHPPSSEASRSLQPRTRQQPVGKHTPAIGGHSVGHLCASSNIFRVLSQEFQLISLPVCREGTANRTFFTRFTCCVQLYGKV